MIREDLNVLPGHEVGIVGDRYRNHPGPYAVNDEGVMKLLPGVNMGKPVDMLHPERDVTTDYGTMETNGLRLLLAIVRDLQPSTILEVGTFRGLTTARMAALAPDARIVTVDLPGPGKSALISSTDEVFADHDATEVGDYFNGTEYALRISQVFADSTSINCITSVESILDVLDVDGFDLVLVDAAHDYWNTRLTFERLVKPLLVNPSIVIFDDYGQLFTHVGVTDYLLSLARTQNAPLYWYAPDGARSAAVMYLHTED